MRSGVQGTIKESDVQRFAGESPSAHSSLPTGLMKYVEREGPLPHSTLRLPRICGVRPIT